jgi:hypothetical protein
MIVIPAFTWPELVLAVLVTAAMGAIGVAFNIVPAAIKAIAAAEIAYTARFMTLSLKR